MDKKLLQECPVCGGTLMVKVLLCPACHTKIEGDFESPKSKILYLPKKDLEFVELFLKLRGNIKEMEKALGVSYPTVRSLLDGIIQKLGYKTTSTVDQRNRKEVIDKLEKGEISAEQAAVLLKGQEEEEV